MKAKRVIFLSASSFFLSYFSRVTWSIVAPLSTLKTTTTEDSIIFALFFLGYILVQIPSGMLADRISANHLLFLSLLGVAITSFISSTFPLIMLEYVASFLMGFSAGWIYPITVKLLSASFDSRDLPIAMSIYSISWPLSIVASGVIIPFLALTFGWEFSFYFITALSIILGILALLYLPSLKLSKSIIKFKDVVKDKNSIYISVGGFLFYLTYWILVLYLYKYLLSVVGNEYTAGIIYSFTALTGIFSTILAGYIIKSLGVKRTFLSFITLYSFSLLLFSFSKNVIVIGIDALALGFFRFVITPTSSTAVAVIGGKERSGSVTGLANFFWQFSGIVGSIIAPLLINLFTYTYLWTFVSVFSFLSLIFYYKLKFMRDYL
ncbi:MFS transporter [Saccharolobus solfataricus]|uniref:Transport membrane protein (Permease) n=3 Tax=Saccharolobus solfataricus TaxID=2287 RepID=Q97Z36_SACS2|nr:MFS transporter [Saccharolobus solfataricus]AAK41360.1 Transport membrane protein (permease) [Saccharolobus solfataricus P2]AKA74304.1 MFS transporter [Saccharolobus solfataricus]AKA77000.1 MFS transporter [Saccharolobus solfataricus]AKA79692.1 MFS transporter [Saccharolobus solfataricus]AZF68787.1 MFS transporter [Saccharolobus solfataricus]